MYVNIGDIVMFSYKDACLKAVYWVKEEWLAGTNTLRRSCTVCVWVSSSCLPCTRTIVCRPTSWLDVCDAYSLTKCCWPLTCPIPIYKSQTTILSSPMGIYVSLGTSSCDLLPPHYKSSHCNLLVCLYCINLKWLDISYLGNM